MTHSTDEISRFLDKLRFEEPPPRGGISNGALEDVVDVSGEDEERASRASLSVAEVRQQTLDALNGTTRSTSELPPGHYPDSSNLPRPDTEPEAEPLLLYPPVGSSARWGAFAGIMGLFLVSQVPIMKQAVLQKTPLLGWYWKVEDAEEQK
ncbi:hypothetical protein GGF46_004948 [Coemansia sp. RSA 552]|nr:hypothetical protein GGF46_004948 [Coemansia sp. RSA 552]